MRLLIAEDQVESVHPAKNGQEAMEIIGSQTIDIALLDIEMPYASGLDVLEWSKTHHPKVKILIFTTFKRPGYFERALKADVDAFVLKERPVHALMATLENILAGKKEYAPELVDSLFTHHNPLTPQERQLMVGVREGLSNKELAQELHLSEGTVRNYMSTVLQKLSAKNRADAIRICQENGWY